MPYVTLSSIDPGELLGSAERRWRALEADRPDLKPAIDLQRALISTVLDVARAVDAVPLAQLSPSYVAAKLARGVSAFTGEPIPFPVGALRAPLLKFCDALAAGGASDSARHIAAAIQRGDVDTGSLLAASLGRNQTAIRQGATHRGLAPDLLWLIAELAISPFAHALQRSLFSAPDEVVAEALSNWNEGCCPACGSWPALAEVVLGHRILRCSFCAAGWELRSYACIYCGESGEAFVTAAPDQERKDRRVEVCGTCAGYLKTVDVAELSPFPLLAIADLETMDLDVAAMERGYRRPALRTASG